MLIIMVSLQNVRAKLVFTFVASIAATFSA